MNKPFKERLLEAQGLIGAIKRDSENPFFKSKYFDINALLAEIKPILNTAGIIIAQKLTHVEGKLALATVLQDAYSDEAIGDICPLPETADAQKAGSAITYFRRYALQSLLALEAEDDDANGAEVGKKALAGSNISSKAKEFNLD